MLINDDNLTYIKTLKKNTIDFIYFDPPFAITEAEYDINLDWSNLNEIVLKMLDNPNKLSYIIDNNRKVYD